MDPVLIVVIVLVIGVIVALIIVGRVSPGGKDPLQTRLAEFSARERPPTLEEIELSQPFSERVLLPIARRLGEFVVRFTPQASLQSIQHQLDLAGNPKGLEPTIFYLMRMGAAGGLGAIALLITFIVPADNQFSFHTGAAKAILIA